jgi:hypothetical protein
VKDGVRYEGWSKYSGWDFWGAILFRLWYRIFVEVVVYLLYEDVIFQSMDAIAFHYSKLQRVAAVVGMMLCVSAPV